MNKQKELAVKVMELANAFTGWNFQMEQEDNFYLVGTTLSNQKGQEMTVYYLIGENWAELQVISTNNEYNLKFLKKKINEIALNYPVYAMGVGEDSISIKSPMLLDVLDRDMAVIIRKRMVDMMQAMTDIINHCK